MEKKEKTDQQKAVERAMKIDKTKRDFAERFKCALLRPRGKDKLPGGTFAERRAEDVADEIRRWILNQIPEEQCESLWRNGVMAYNHGVDGEGAEDWLPEAMKPTGPSNAERVTAYANYIAIKASNLAGKKWHGRNFKSL